MRLYGSFEKFGNYLLLDRLATGGMAEVYVARPASSSANGRFLIVKRILESFLEERESIDMFRAEMEICLGLNNPNIVQTHDFGYVAGRPYIAMEFIDGKSVRQILNQQRSAGHLPCPGFVASIGAQAASGLHYAHTLRNRATGQELEIVHRDISPQNLILSYDGNLKIIDFGIAKALTETSKANITRAGTIKGKVSYLSPEQASLLPLDSRSDIFSLGIVIWELLTLEKLFDPSGKMDSEIIHMIRTCAHRIRPPSAYNRGIPPLLDEIVLRALANSPEQRYQTAEEMQSALRNYLYIHHAGYGYSHVAESIRLLFRNELAEEQKYLRLLNSRAQEVLSLPAEETTVTQSVNEESPSLRLHRSSGLEIPSSFPVQQPSFTPKEVIRPTKTGGLPPELMSHARGASTQLRSRSMGFPVTLFALSVVYMEIDPIYSFIKDLSAKPGPAQTRSAIQERRPAESALEPTTPPSATAPSRETPGSVAPKAAAPDKTAEPQYSWVLLRIRVRNALRDMSRITVNGENFSGSAAEIWVRNDRPVKIRVENRRTYPFERWLDLSAARATPYSKNKTYTLKVQLKNRMRLSRH